MAKPQLPETERIAEAFVEQYYLILSVSPENVHKFYQESSVLGWQENKDIEPSVTTLSGIDKKIMSSDFKNGNVETLTVDAQESLNGGVFVAVSGLWTSSDNSVKRRFSQSFFLAQQEKGFFVLNDILRLSNTSELTTVSSVNNDDKVTEAAANSVPVAVLSTAADINASNTEEAVKKDDIKEAIEAKVPAADITASIPKDVEAKAVTKPSSPSSEKVSPVIKPASDGKVEALKITYASVVAKPSLAKLSPPTSPKASASRVGVAPKAPASSVSKQVSKASSPPSNVGPKSLPANNGAPNAIPEARAIYVGGLPFDITEQGVADVMKKFGPLRRHADNVRLKKDQRDGFCCGFVEFESADAARRAVEVRNVQFGDKEAYCLYRKHNNGGNDGRGRSPPRGGSQNGNFRGRGNGQVSNGRRSQSGNRSGNSNGQARGPR